MATNANTVPPTTTAQTKLKAKPPRTKASRTDRQRDHYALVLEAARNVTQILESYGLHCALFGSLASRLYGASRTPKDVDVLVCSSPAFVKTLERARRSTQAWMPAGLRYLKLRALAAEAAARNPPPVPAPAPGPIDGNDATTTTATTMTATTMTQGDGGYVLTAHDIKELILFTNCRNFYLRMPRDPEATYRILYYRRSPTSMSRKDECKIDILIPGIMYLPSLDRFHPLSPSVSPNPNPNARRQTTTKNLNHTLGEGEMTFFQKEGLWCVPFGLLLLHKLQGWDDHRKAEEEHKRKKQDQDAADVKRLLTLTSWVLGLRPADVVAGEEKEQGKENVNANTNTNGKAGGKGKKKKQAKQQQQQQQQTTTTPSTQQNGAGPTNPIPPSSTTQPSFASTSVPLHPPATLATPNTHLWWTNSRLFSPEFQALTKTRVFDYCMTFPGRVVEFKMMGFEVPSEEQLEEAKRCIEEELQRAKKEKEERKKGKKEKQGKAVGGGAAVGKVSVERAEQDDDDDDDADLNVDLDETDDDDDGAGGAARVSKPVQTNGPSTSKLEPVGVQKQDDVVYCGFMGAIEDSRIGPSTTTRDSVEEDRDILHVLVL